MESKGCKLGSRQVNVRVLNGSREIATAESRPVRILPSGRAGVVYGGEVYPLYQDDRIQISDLTFDKYDCTSFVRPGDPIPYAPPYGTAPITYSGGIRLLSEVDWHVESNRFGHYVAFNATEAEAEGIVDVLDESLGVRRWDASHRAADDGIRYDWFARLAAPTDWDHQEVLRQVRSVVSSGSDRTAKGVAAASTIDVGSIPETQRATILSALSQALAAAQENKLLASQKNTLQQSLDEATQRHVQLATENSDIQAELSASRESANKAQSRLQGRIDALLAQAEANAAAHQAEVEQVLRENSRLRDGLTQAEAAQSNALSVEQMTLGLRGELDAERSRSQEAEEHWYTAEADKEALVGRLSALENDLLAVIEENERLTTKAENQEAQLQEFRNEAQEIRTRRRESARARDRRKSVEDFIDDVLGRVELDEQSVHTLLDFRKPAKAFRYLTMLANGESIPGVDHGPLHGYKGCWEVTNVHIGEPGAEDHGRIYYQRSADGDGVRTFVHKKTGRQEQDRYLKKCFG